LSKSALSRQLNNRRLLFAKHEELLSSLDAEWGKAQHGKYAEILKEHPFNDNSEL
jgi:hypothetical protein